MGMILSTPWCVRVAISCASATICECVCVRAQVLITWGGRSIEALHDEFYSIFPKTNNRNAASHLWATFVLRRGIQLEQSEVRELMQGFCSVSGSPITPVSGVWIGGGWLVMCVRW